MKIHLKKLIARYFNSCWLPALAALVILAFSMITGLSSPRCKSLAIVSMGLLIILGFLIIGILAASIWNMIKRRFVKGFINFLMLPLVAAFSIFTIGFLIVFSMLGPSEDGFADELTIPGNIDVSEPLNELQRSPGGPEDSFQTRLLAALQTQSNGDPSVTAMVDSLARLRKGAPDVLFCYLATSPSWRVFEERGSVFATRRWMIGSQWRYDLHGYYSSHDLNIWRDTDIPDFQSRVTIGLSGKPWARISRDSTQMTRDQTKHLTLSGSNSILISHCIITVEDLTLEIFEQSDAEERRLTKAVLAYIDEELRPLTESPEWMTIRKILPTGSIKHGEPSLELRNSFQPGIYDSVIWANPGEPGMLYLKALEVTRGTALSVHELKKYSNEWIGWSDDPSELFFSNTLFTINEGDWGKPYAARFEVWFVPDSGQPERRLMEKIFKIEGWQR